PEVQGNEIDDKILQEYISGCLAETLKKAVGQPAEAAGAELHTSYEFPAESCVKPKIYQNDEGLLTKREALNTYSGAEVTYVFGEEEMKLDLFALSELMDINGKTAELSDEKIGDFVSRLEEKYDTRYIDRTFHTSYDEDIVIEAKYNDYGYTIVGEDEAEQLREDIESRKPVKREPIYIETNSWGNPYYLRRDGVDDMAGTYIEVDLTAQHMWYYRDGELYLDSPVVSGDVTKGRGTQTGCFPLAYKESPSVLTGGQGDGEYETKVQYWMPFYEGQGLHDADWRYYFGGSIYRGNGSHGCVNLPVGVAAELYSVVEVGTAIVIYYE
ncbi:MAG: L,D-transpeptidase, partial [Eubacteriales bacterium]|nr:L,D-transpeptidase [Eubacteriales bacterium]